MEHQEVSAPVAVQTKQVSCRWPNHCVSVTSQVTFVVIETFRHKGLEDFFLSGSKRGIHGDAYDVDYVDYH